MAKCQEGRYLGRKRCRIVSISCPPGSLHLTIFRHLWLQKYLPYGQIGGLKWSFIFLSLAYLFEEVHI